MVATFVLCLALFSGSSSAFWLEDEVIASNGTSNTTVLHQYPWIVQVDFLNHGGWVGWTQNCAATILNSRNLLSAATCFSGWSYPGPFSRRVRAGANYRLTGGVIVYVDRAINYQQNGTNVILFHDITVVRLSSRLILGSLIQQAAIVAHGSVIPGGVVLQQVGWGVMGGGQPNDTFISLRSATVTTFNIASNQTQPSNATSSILRAYPSFAARVNGDVGGPWILGNVTVGVISGLKASVNGSWSDSIKAASVAAYTNWIVSVAV